MKAHLLLTIILQKAQSHISMVFDSFLDIFSYLFLQVLQHCIFVIIYVHTLRAHHTALMLPQPMISTIQYYSTISTYVILCHVNPYTFLHILFPYSYENYIKSILSLTG